MVTIPHAGDTGCAGHVELALEAREALLAEAGRGTTPGDLMRILVA
jgi:hypothetical protein